VPASKIKVDYALLERVAALFGREAEATRRAREDLTRASADLEYGDWVGPGARAFMFELRDDVLPALRRLQEALSAAQRATARILAIARQAESDAADALRRLPESRPSAAAGDALWSIFGAAAPGVPPRIYIINGINNRRGNAPGDLLDPKDSMVKLRDYLVGNGYDPAEVVVTAPVFNTNLSGAWRASLPLEPANGLTSVFARSVNTLTGAALDAVNTVVGVGQVLDEYATRGGSQTQRIEAFVRADLARHPLLPGQGVALLGHSGGGVIAANLAPRLEGDRVARQAGMPSPLDVLGVVTLGAPIVNYDAASQVAPVLMLRHAGDPFGLPALRSDEARSQMTAALLALATGPAGLGTLGEFVGFDLYARNKGAGAVVDLAYDAGPDGAHRSYWQANSTVYQALLGGLGLGAP
jgi:uncharacterized protein YukE